MAILKKINKEEMEEVAISLRPIVSKYLEANGQKAVCLVDYIGFPINHMTICTVNPSNFGFYINIV